MTNGALNNKHENFCLSKWYLDFAGENGEAMIFYAAQLTWHSMSAKYTSWLSYNPESGVVLKSRFRKVQMPVLDRDVITWKDSDFGVSGTWSASMQMIQARLFDSKEGYLDWECYQPASKVKLLINERTLTGVGYAEQLTLTASPWRIPMDELRWGRFGSDSYNLVWIELRKSDKKQWLWLNGEKIGTCLIEDDRIVIQEGNLTLYLDRQVILESEKKIQSVVGKIIRYLPNFHKSIPLGFLMADETKWLSKCELHSNGKVISNGTAIHELVNFKQ